MDAAAVRAEVRAACGGQCVSAMLLKWSSRAAHLGPAQVLACVVDAALEEVHLGEDHFVVEPLELLEQRLDEQARRAVVLRVELAGSHRA